LVKKINDGFRSFAQRVAIFTGTPWAFLFAFLTIIVWLVTGPVFHFSDTWQLVINTGTTIVTFLMVFMIQNTQNRDAKVIHLKLDELIRTAEEARNNLMDLENMSDEELEHFQRQFQRLRGLYAAAEKLEKEARSDPEGNDLIPRDPLSQITPRTIE
jgi:low affinity Fe/Cu permease